MSIISRYIIKVHIGPFLFGTLTVVFLFLFQFLLKYIDQLVGKGLDSWVIIQLIALNVAWMLVLAVPMGVLFSTLMAFGGMSANHEVTIIKASGGSLIKMMFPMIILGIITSVALFWFNDQVLPDANHRAKALMNDITRKKPTFSIEAGEFATQIDGYTILSRAIDSISGILKGVTIYDNTKSNRVNIASADTGIIAFNGDYTKLIVNLYNGEIHQVVPSDPNNYRKINFQHYQITMNASGFAFERTSEGFISRGDREMKIRDMGKIVNDAERITLSANIKLRRQLDEHLSFLLGRDTLKSSSTNQIEGDTNLVSVYQNFDKRITFLRTSITTDLYTVRDQKIRAQEYDVEIQKKYAIPFACLLFVFVGCPLGIMTKGGNFGLSAGISLAFYIFYWACLIGGEKLADRGFMTPFLSMWLGNILIGIMGLILTLKVNNESLSFLKFRALFKSRK